jgi:hypothetical protein
MKEDYAGRPAPLIWAGVIVLYLLLQNGVLA